MFKSIVLAGVAVLASAALSVPASADDPNDPSMRTKAARDRDREIIRQLNLKQLREVRARDAQYAEGWAAYRAYHGSRDRPLPRCRQGQRTNCRR